LDALGEFDIDYHDHLWVARRVWELRDNLTAYDATYVALAELLDTEPVTADSRLVRVPGHHVSITAIG
jgi:predicted nucleic acid-binding protein